MSSEEEESSVGEEEVEDEESVSGSDSGQAESESEEEESESEEEEVPVKKTKKRKKDKDPNKPKRNMSAYFLFSTQNRARLKEENAGISFGDLARLISSEFKALPDDEKDVWQQKAAADKKRYEQEMLTYVPPSEDSDSDSEDGGRKKKKKKDPNKPKRNMSAYFIFSNAHRPEVRKTSPGASFGEVAKIISRDWKALTEEDKQEWNEKAAKDKIRYQEQMKVYNS